MFGTVLAGLLGLAFGSFLNVCLSRWPAGESVVRPGSHCRSCGRTLAWWENVPLLSWLALQGRCRKCKATISWRYPLVELAVGILWAYVTWQHITEAALSPTGLELPISFSPLFLAQFFGFLLAKMLLTWVLVGLAFLDAEHFWLPDVATLSMTGIGIIVTYVHRSPVMTIGDVRSRGLGNLLQTAFAIVIAAGLILLIRWTYKLIRHREGIGLGDAKLMAMLGAWLGLQGALLAFGIGVVLGALTAAALQLAPKKDDSAPVSAMTKLPLGTFLCIGGVVSALWGQPIIAAYMRYAGF